LSEYEQDAIEDSSDLAEEEVNDEIAESSAALDEESSEVVEEEGSEKIAIFESEKANERFSKLTTETKEVKADSAAVKAENEALRRRIEAIETATVPEYVDPGAPILDHFDYDVDKHQAAVIAYEAEKTAHRILTQQRQATQQASEMAAKSAMFDVHNQKRMALSASVPDLGVTLDRSLLNNQTQGGHAAAEGILRQDNGADVEYFIAKNPEIAVRINNMDQFTAYGEVARIAETLKVKPKKGAALPKPLGASPSGGGQSSEHKAVFSVGATFE